MAGGPLTLAELLESWQIELRGENKAEGTLKSYRAGVTLFIRWCDANGHEPALTAPLVHAWIGELLASGAAASTALSRQKALRQFSRWLHTARERDTDHLAGIRPPKLDRKVLEPLTGDELRSLIEACRGKTLYDRRDEAAARLLAETGIRAGECVALTVDDIDLHAGLAIVRRGKGGKGRTVPFGAATAAALDRYLRARRHHAMADTPYLWLGYRSTIPLSYAGLNKALAGRAKTAGINRFHLHLFRHTAASRWLAAGGSEQGLMSVAGWSNRALLDRYTTATAASRAIDESRGLGLGDL